MDMDRRSLVGLGLASAGLAMAGAARAAPAGVEVERDGAGRYGAALEDIRAYAALHVAVYGLPGLTLTVTAPDGVTAAMRFGLADVDRGEPVGADHLFQIGSISKSFTALCVFQLVEAGKLSLDADVRGLLPGVPWPQGPRITVQNLLSHSSGLPDDAPIFPRGGDQRLWLGYAPGSHWSYSNLGYMLLGTLVERIEGRPLAEVLRRKVLDPLGMTGTRPAILTADRALYASGYSPFYADRAYPRAGRLGPAPWVDMVEGSGCVAAPARDMARYARFLVAAGRGKGGPVLSDASAARFCAPTIAAPGWAAKGAKYANGLAVVEIGGRPLLHHTGGMLAFSSAIHVDPVAGVGAFASTNVGSTGYRPREITAFACERLRAVVEARPVPIPPPAPPKAPDTAPYVGRYAARSGEVLEIRPGARGLAAVSPKGAVEMEASEPDAYVAVDPAAAAHPLVFRRAGKAVARAWWGDVEYVRVEDGKPTAAFTAPSSPAIRGLTGHYENDDPWRGGTRVTAHGESLFLDGTTPLTALPGGGFRVGVDTWSPERARFGAELDGKAQRLNLSGVDYLRRTT